jgi:iron complex transport system ATP-binding protein
VSELVFDRLSVRLGDRLVVEEMTLSVAEGRVTALVGPNGAGKSTAVKAAAGLLRPAAGDVRVDGRSVAAWRPGDFARRVAYVAQSPTLPALFTVRDVVALGRTPHIPFLGVEGAHDRAVIETALAETGIAGLASRRVGELSGGERQRVALARALAQEPRILLLDEPTAALDLRYQATIFALARELAEARRIACLAVIHDISLASQFCDHIAVMHAGRIVAAGPPPEVFQPALLSKVYATPLAVIAHPESGRPIVVHSTMRGP